MMLTTLRPLVAGVAMLGAAAAAHVLRPSERIADQSFPVTLEQMVPVQFRDWRIDHTLAPIAPLEGTATGKVYSQTLARTYVNASGERVMLSIAYGPDQRGSATQIHQPESCYTMQGFRLTRNSVARLETAFGTLPVTRLMAVQGARNEPITYWMIVGDRSTLPGLDRKLAQLRYGLTGRVADGMLVRVSTINRDVTRAYAVQDTFVRDLLGEVSEQYRVRLTGLPGA